MINLFKQQGTPIMILGAIILIIFEGWLVLEMPTYSKQYFIFGGFLIGIIIFIIGILHNRQFYVDNYNENKIKFHRANDR